MGYQFLLKQSFLRKKYQKSSENVLKAIFEYWSWTEFL